jgi:hypothetical protein
VAASDRDPVAQAVKDGKIPATRAQHYRDLMKQDPEGTRHLLTAAPQDGGLVAPVEGLSTAPLPAEVRLTPSGGGVAYPPEWLGHLPEAARPGANVQHGGRVVIAGEG